jgi:hypothetical protein
MLINYALKKIRVKISQNFKVSFLNYTINHKDCIFVNGYTHEIWVQSIGEMTETGENQSTFRKKCTTGTSPTTTPSSNHWWLGYLSIPKDILKVLAQWTHFLLNLAGPDQIFLTPFYPVVSITGNTHIPPVQLPNIFSLSPEEEDVIWCIIMQR